MGVHGQTSMGGHMKCHYISLSTDRENGSIDRTDKCCICVQRLTKGSYGAVDHREVDIRCCLISCWEEGQRAVGGIQEHPSHDYAIQQICVGWTL